MPGVTTAYQTGVHGSRPAANSGCILYSCTTHGLVYRSDGTSWTTWLTLPSGSSSASPSLTFSTTASAGAASTFVATDATIPIFDATAPTTQAFGDSAAAGSAAFAARRDHKHAWPATAFTLSKAAADSTAQDNLTADTETDASGCSFSLVAGTWNVWAMITFSTAGGGSYYILGVITDSSNVHQGMARGLVTSGSPVTLSLFAQVAPGSTTTYKLRGQSGLTNNKIERYATGTTIGTRIWALRVA